MSWSGKDVLDAEPDAWVDAGLDAWHAVACVLGAGTVGEWASAVSQVSEYVYILSTWLPGFDVNRGEIVPWLLEDEIVEPGSWVEAALALVSGWGIFSQSPMWARQDAWLALWQAALALGRHLPGWDERRVTVVEEDQ